MPQIRVIEGQKKVRAPGFLALVPVLIGRSTFWAQVPAAFLLGLAVFACSAGAQTPATGTVSIPSVLNYPICAGVPWGDFWGVTVNGVTAQISDYPPPSTTAIVAQQLAAKINSTITFVTASASQNVITITTKATGSATNYPFSGYFGPYQIDGNFHPGCTGFLGGLPTSGPTLTGGMDAPVQGYINPKYMIVGLTYAPPGSQSSATYTNSVSVGNTTTINSSFTNQTSVSVSVTAQGKIPAFADGKATGTYTNTYGQTSSTSNTVTVTKTTQVSDKTSGPTNSVVGLNHDFDIIWLWLNPVLPLSFPPTNPNAITWSGFGYDANDQPGLDILPVFVGWLNGDIPVPSNVAAVLARTWASSYTWGPNTGPGLTGPGLNTDFSTILQADPFGQCTPMPTSCPTTVDSTRFTLSDNQNVVYEQAPPGGQPITQTYQLQYTNTSTQGQGTSTTQSQAYGLDVSFSGGLFGSGISTAFKTSNTLTWTTSANTSITNTGTSTALASITGPACTPSGNSCSPAYTGPVEFEIYQDNQYGTFMFFPVNGTTSAPLAMPTSSSLPNPSSGLPYGPQLLTATGGSGTGYTWCVQSGAQCVQSGPPMPPGFSLSSKSSCGNACTQIALSSTGTPPAPVGSYNFTVQVTDSVGGFAAQPVSMNIAQGPLNVTGQVAITSSGLAYSRVSQTFNGTVTIKNIGITAIGGPLQVLFFGLPGNVTLTNATGNVSTTPYMTIPGGLAPGQTVSVPVQFKNPLNNSINLTPSIYSGRIN